MFSVTFYSKYCNEFNMAVIITFGKNQKYSIKM